MATKTTTVTFDDIDGTEGAMPYLIISPANGETYTVDLSEKNADALAKALTPYLAAARKWSKSTPSVSAPTPAKAGKRATRVYDGDGLKAWAIAKGTWTGKRPSNAMIDEYEASLTA